jgi:recombinational DNA repair protein (RecF pathway)
MYQMYITDALVCGTRNSNTSDRAFLLFARDAGMLWASARSVREERSKQRYALQDFSHEKCTLVKGKGGWRIAGVEPHTNFYYLTSDRKTRTLLRNVVRLLRRVMGGETAHPELFDDVIATLYRSKEDTENLELIMSLRVLHGLGYIAPHPAYEYFLHTPKVIEAVEELTEEKRKACQKVIEEALIYSQL